MFPKLLPSAYVQSIPYVSGIACIHGPGLFGFSYQGYIWVCYLVIGIFILLTQRSVIFFPWKLWVPWIFFVSISLFWSSFKMVENVQPFLQILTPLIVGLVASSAVNNEKDLERLFRGFSHGLIVIFIVFITFYFGPLISYQFEAEQLGSGIQLPHYGARPTAMSLALVGGIFISQFAKRRFVSLIGWAVCLSIVFLSGSRMGTFVLLTIWLVLPTNRFLLSKVLTVAFLMGLSIALFYSSTLQNRFFLSGEGTISQIPKGEFDDAGRFEFWSVTWKEAGNHLFIGRGVGEADIFISTVFEIGQVHNDFLRIVFEFGITGLILFLYALWFQIFDLRRKMGRSDSTTRMGFLAAYLGMFSWLLFSVTDNSLIYGVYFTHPLFAITGASYGVFYRTSKARV